MVASGCYFPRPAWLSRRVRVEIGRQSEVKGGRDGQIDRSLTGESVAEKGPSIVIFTP